MSATAPSYGDALLIGPERQDPRKTTVALVVSLCFLPVTWWCLTSLGHLLFDLGRDLKSMPADRALPFLATQFSTLSLDVLPLLIGLVAPPLCINWLAGRLLHPDRPFRVSPVAVMGFILCAPAGMILFATSETSRFPTPAMGGSLFLLISPFIVSAPLRAPTSAERKERYEAFYNQFRKSRD